MYLYLSMGFLGQLAPRQDKISRRCIFLVEHADSQTNRAMKPDSAFLEEWLLAGP